MRTLPLLTWLCHYLFLFFFLRFSSFFALSVQRRRKTTPSTEHTHFPGVPRSLPDVWLPLAARVRVQFLFPLFGFPDFAGVSAVGAFFLNCIFIYFWGVESILRVSFHPEISKVLTFRVSVQHAAFTFRMIVYVRSLTTVSGNGSSVAFECFGWVHVAANYSRLFNVLFFSFHFIDCLLFLKA